MANDIVEIRDARTEKRFFIDNTIIRDYGKTLTPYGISVYAALCMHARLETQTCYPSHATIADEIGCGVTSVKTALALLKELGLIAWQQHYREDGGQGSNTYVILDPPSCGDQGGSRDTATNNPKIEQSLDKDPATSFDVAAKGEEDEEPIISTTGRHDRAPVTGMGKQCSSGDQYNAGRDGKHETVYSPGGGQDPGTPGQDSHSHGPAQPDSGQAARETDSSRSPGFSDGNSGRGERAGVATQPTGQTGGGTKRHGEQARQLDRGTGRPSSQARINAALRGTLTRGEDDPVPKSKLALYIEQQIPGQKIPNGQLNKLAMGYTEQLEGGRTKRHPCPDLLWETNPAFVEYVKERIEFYKGISGSQAVKRTRLIGALCKYKGTYAWLDWQGQPTTQFKEI